MNRITRIASALLLTAVLVFTLVVGGKAQQVWVDLVQMPVAVARAEVAGVPVAELRLVAPALNADRVEPGLFIETMRVLPAARDVWIEDGMDRDRDVLRERDRAGSDEGMGGFVQAMLDRGLRGGELADAIHGELNRRGVPAESRGARRGPPPASGDFIVDIERIRRGAREGRGRPDGAGPPGRGRPDEAGNRGRGQGQGRGQGEGPPPAAGDRGPERGGPPGNRGNPPPGNRGNGNGNGDGAGGAR